MSIAGIFQDVRPSIEGLGAAFVFDMLQEATHRVRAVWTEEPVEDGSTLSDHRWLPQRDLVLTVVVSSAEALPFDRTAHLRAWQRLRDLVTLEPPQLFTIVTSDETYDNMGLVEVSKPQTRDTTGAMFATITAHQIEIGKTGVAQNLADAAQDGGLAEVNTGTQGFVVAA